MAKLQTVLKQLEHEQKRAQKELEQLEEAIFNIWEADREARSKDTAETFGRWPQADCGGSAGALGKA